MRESGLGSSVRYWRLRRGFSQAQLAELANVSITVVRKLEQENDPADGPRGVRLGTLYALARALGVQTAQLFPAASPEPADQDPVHLALLPVRVALTPPLLAATTAAKHAAEPELRSLRRDLARSVRLYDSDRYDQTALHLPGLLRVARGVAARYAGYEELREALDLRSGVLQLVGWFLTQVGAHDLAYQAIRDGLADSRTCGDALTAAACVVCECWLFIRQGRLLDAKRTAAETADLVEPRRLKEATAGDLSVWGWLLLLAWAAAIRNNQEDEAREFLRLAKAAAAGTGGAAIRHEHYWTTLGPATIAMKEVEHQVIIGSYREALKLAEQVPAARRARADVWQRHQLDLAIAHAGLGNRADAAGILTGLRARAPHWLRHQRLGRDTARKLVASSARSLPPEVRALADFYDFGGPGSG
jgi:transcriptional regulator with XRE-family HTH domain